jgi:hypothetical protein
MLWFDDNSARTVEEKIRRAANHYMSKYGNTPKLCYVHPSMLNGDKLNSDGIEVRTANTVLPHHFWLGQEGSKRRKSAA